MPYDIVFAEPIDNIEDGNAPAWLYNSYTTILHWDSNDYNMIDRHYEREFNVKIIYPPSDPEGRRDDTICGIQFPSQSEATLFVLRWS